MFHHVRLSPPLISATCPDSPIHFFDTSRGRCEYEIVVFLALELLHVTYVVHAGGANPPRRDDLHFQIVSILRCIVRYRGLVNLRSAARFLLDLGHAISKVVWSVILR